MILQYDCLEKIILDQDHELRKWLVDRLEELTASSMTLQVVINPNVMVSKSFFLFFLSTKSWKLNFRKKVNKHHDNWDNFLLYVQQQWAVLHCGIFAVYH